MKRLVPAGLTARLLVGAGLVVALLIGAFVALALAVHDLREQTDVRERADATVTSLDRVLKSVLDLETGVRAFMITDQPRFLEPWELARSRLPAEVRELEQRVAGEAGGGEHARLHRLLDAEVDSYLREQSIPLVLRLRSGRVDAEARVAETAEGKRRVDTIRDLVSVLREMELNRAIDAEERADRAAASATTLGIGSLIVLVGVFLVGVLHFARTVTRPVTRVAAAAEELAAGRVPEALQAGSQASGAAREIVSLTASFDVMVEVVHEQRDRLQRLNLSLERRVRERTADVEQARYEALLMVAVAAEYRDDDTHRHTQRVGRNAGLIAERLGLGDEAVELLRAAAPLHDVGKIGVSDLILLKPGRLTAEEFATMKEHVAIGASILGSSPAPLFHVAAEIALTHHERWDGSGYLEGLAGNAIPLAGRIVAVVDVFDALTHSRPYKEPWPVERAVDEIRRGAGSHFDPDVVAAFESLDPRLLVDDREPESRAANSLSTALGA